MTRRTFPPLYRAVDYHTAGEPLRIVVDGVAPPAGVSVADRRLAAVTGEDGGHAERARRLLCAEPRGHADMYGAFVVPPDRVSPGVARAELGVLFWHKDGFSTACGHGTIALATWAVDDGLVDVDPEGATSFGIDVPSGRVQVAVRSVAGRVADVTFTNVPAWVSAEHLTIRTSGGRVEATVGYGGAFYVSVRAMDLGLTVRPKNLPTFIALTREIRAFFAADPIAAASVTHLQDPRLSGLYGCIWYEDLRPPDAGDGPAPAVHQRNVTVFADGQVDRSPCGSGTSAQLAMLHRDLGLGEDDLVWNESIIGSRFEAWIGAQRPDGLLTQIRGSAYRTGQHSFVLDPRDGLDEGFVLR